MVFILEQFKQEHANSSVFRRVNMSLYWLTVIDSRACLSAQLELKSQLDLSLIHGNP